MERIQKLNQKQSLNASDAAFILQFIQEQTAPLLSLRSSYNSPSTAAEHELNGQHSGSCGRHKVVHKKQHAHRSGCGGTSRNDRQSLDFASLNEFPPVSMSLQETNRSHSLKPKRRITPTLLKSEPVLSPFPFSESGSPWKESSHHHNPFIGPDTQSPVFDCRQAVKEDRNQLQKEIASRKCAAGKKLGRNQVKSGNSLEHKCGQNPASYRSKDQSSVIEEESDDQRMLTLKFTDRATLDQISVLYCNIIRGFLVPNIVSEMHFILQLLTLTLPPAALHRLYHMSHSTVFESVDDCVYFSLSVMDNIKQYFLMLDKNTLQLLIDNDRIGKLSPQLRSFFSTQLNEGICNQIPLLSGIQSQHDTQVVGVQFQEDTDNSKNFPDVKAFHAFKKQRDTFYSILRDWEKHHNDPKWTLRDRLGDKIRTITSGYSDICSSVYFAKLFMKQVVMSCYSSVTGSDLVQSGLSHQLNKMDPRRLIELTRRFYAPSSGSSDPCPPPAFTQAEEFFAEFINIADSYSFNQHLILAITDKINELHGASTFTLKDAKKYFDVLHTLRVLAKFLGFLDFLPFVKSTCGMPSRNQIVSLDLVQCLDEACAKGHLGITVPWVVQYMSMMDNQAPRLRQYHSVLTLLIEIYKSLRACSVTNNICYLLTCTLGWLFEIPNFPPALFSKHVMDKSNLTHSFGSIPDSLDTLTSISSDILYLCCPFLSDMRSLLAEYAAGLQTKSTPMRKIKPLSTTIEAIDKDPLEEVQSQLVDSFFRSHPPYLKQLCETTAERVSSSAIIHIESCIIPKYTEPACSQCIRWLQKRMSNFATQNFLQFQAECFMESLLSDVNAKLNVEIKKYSINYCHTQSKGALTILLQGSCMPQVIIAAYEIAAKWSTRKCFKWSSSNASVKVREQVLKVFERGHRVILSRSQNSNGQKEAISPAAHLVHRQEESTLSASKQEEDAHSGFQDVTPHAQFISVLSSFKSVHQALKCTEELSSDGVLNLVRVMVQMIEVIQSNAFILPDVPSPPQVISSHYQDFANSSIDLAVDLVCHGSFKTYHFHQSSECDLLDYLLDCWKLCRGLKLEISVDKLLNSTAFEKYLISDKDGCVWLSLANLLVLAVRKLIVPSSMVEGLWLCQWHQLSKSSSTKFLPFIEAVSVFLKVWHSLCSETISDQEPLFMSVHFVRLSSVYHSNHAPPSSILLPHIDLINLF